MKKSTFTPITIETEVKSPIEHVWKYWTTPEHIVQWNNASEDWHTTKAENDVRTGGKFMSRMEAKDGSFGFDFEGIYDEVIKHKLILYSLADGRKVKISFVNMDASTKVIETFDAENENPIEIQRGGWQSILDNFKKHVEKNSH